MAACNTNNEYDPGSIASEPRISLIRARRRRLRYGGASHDADSLGHSEGAAAVKSGYLSGITISRWLVSTTKTASSFAGWVLLEFALTL